jgi:hypothetical protein
MPLQHAVTFQAFHKITNFICNNGDDWDKFCSSTTRLARKIEKAPPSRVKPSKHKTAENEGCLTIKSVLRYNPHRFVLFPIQNADIWRMYEKVEASFWTAEEIDLLADLADWNNLSQTERLFISHVLAFFAASAGIVNENLSSNFATKITAPDARCFYSFQVAVKKHSQQDVFPTHQQVYQGPCTETTPAPCHNHSTMHSTQSKLGTQMVQSHQCYFCQTHNRICRR